MEQQRVDGANTMLEAALRYAARGWQVVPLWSVHNGVCQCLEGKKCKTPGKHPRTHHGAHGGSIDPIKMKSWRWATANIGIVTGSVSGLVVIDIDPRNGGKETLEQLKVQLGELPPCPVVVTGGGGWHGYFKHPGVPCKDELGPGVDLKADGGLVVAPPSVHFSGGDYKWVKDGDLPELPAAWVEAMKAPIPLDVTDDIRRQLTTSETSETTEDTIAGSVPLKRGTDHVSQKDYIQECIRKTIPEAPGQRHRNVFKLARLLKGHPDIGTWSLKKLRPLVDRWHAEVLLELGKEGMNADVDENFSDFAEGWDKVRFPGGGRSMNAMMERVRQGPLPKVAMEYQTDEMRLLVGLCRELQREAGDKPFFLATTDAASLLGIDENERMRVWRYLNLLCMENVLRLVEKGRQKHANRYRYIGGD